MPTDALTLYDHVGELLMLLDEESQAPEHREQYAQLIREHLTTTRDKVDRVAAALATLDAHAEACQTEIERLGKRKAQLDNAAQRLKGYILDVMAGAGLKKLEGATSALTMRCNAPSVDIWDDSAIPAEWLVETVSTRPDKKAIKAYVLGGGTVPGAKLVQTLSLLRR